MFSGLCQDAPDNEEVSREAQEKDESQDEGAHSGGSFVLYDALIWRTGVVLVERSVAIGHFGYLPKREYWYFTKCSSIDLHKKQQNYTVFPLF